jgi:hypothetical protein
MMSLSNRYVSALYVWSTADSSRSPVNSTFHCLICLLQRIALRETLEQANQENAKLLVQLEEAEQEYHKKQGELTEIEKDCKELEGEIAHFGKLQATARVESEALKKQANDLKDELDTANWALQEAEAEEERLRMQVVSSPDRRKRELSSNRERLQMEKKQYRELTSTIEDCKTKALNVQQAAKDLDMSLVALKALEQVAVEHGNIVDQLDNKLQAIKLQDKEKEAVLAKTAEAERSLHRSEEKIAFQRKQQKLQKTAVHEAIDAATAQLLAVEKDRRDGMQRIAAGEAEIQALEEAIEKERLKTEEEIQEIVREYKKTETLFLERTEHRLKTIGASTD